MQDYICSCVIQNQFACAMLVNLCHQMPLQSEMDSFYSHVAKVMSFTSTQISVQTNVKMWLHYRYPNTVVSVVAMVHAYCSSHLVTLVLYMCISFIGPIDLELLVRCKLIPRQAYICLVVVMVLVIAIVS